MPKAREPEVHVHDVSKLRGRLKVVSGSMSDDWNNNVANQTAQTLWFFENSDPDEIRRERHAAVDALIGIKPGDEAWYDRVAAYRRPQCVDGMLPKGRDSATRHSKDGART